MKRVLALTIPFLYACGGAQSPAPAPAPATPAPTHGQMVSTVLGCDAVHADAAPDEVVGHTLPPTPCWANKYVDRIDENVRYFNITSLMAGHGLSRLAAVEVQNHYRDIMRADDKGDRGQAFQTALERAKAGTFESGVDPEAMKAARFIVVFDLDETFYDQRTGSAECTDFSYTYEKKGETKTKYIKMVPGWEDAVARIRALDGQVVIFTANLDDRSLLNLKNITLDGKPLTESPAIAGIMTNSYLTQQSTLEPPGVEGKAWKGRPVFEPSKDLRHFDEALEKAILVDDNPLRFFQHRNTRTFQKFHADKLCGAEDAELRAAYEGAMPAVVAEIEESVAWQKANEGKTFAEAWLPYSDLGQVTVRLLMQTRSWDAAQARAYVRQNPGIVSAKF